MTNTALRISSPNTLSISLARQISHTRGPSSLFLLTESTFLILLMIPKTYIPSNLSIPKFKKWCYFDGDGDEARKVYRIVFRVLQIHASSSPYFSTLVKLPFSYKASLNLMWSKWGRGKSKTDLVLSKNFYLCWRLMYHNVKEDLSLELGWNYTYKGLQQKERSRLWKSAFWKACLPC